ncbi:MAG: tetratricopeptide repeat protein [Planctomycetia bacterium]|nr:tetratricopeptide repeat protein [Planctomycetia bacterium]
MRRAARRLSVGTVVLGAFLVPAFGPEFLGLGGDRASRPAHAADDPDRPAYDRVLAAYKAKRFGEALEAARGFVAAHPDHKFAHSALFMAAQSAYELRRWDDVVAEADRYLVRFPTAEYADRVTVRRAQAHFKARRPKEAAAGFDAFVAAKPGASLAGEARAWRARIDPVDRDVRGNVVLDYAGKYRGDATYAARVAEVERLVPEAVKRIRARLALPAGPPPPFRVRFADIGERPSDLHMSTSEELVGGEVRQALRIYTEPLVLRRYDLADTLTHELLHVWHRHVLGEPYYDVPKWAREGLAVWAAGQGPGRLGLMAVVFGSDPKVTDPVARIVNGLGGSHSVTDYAEDYLAFAWVEERKGLAGAQALARRLLATSDVAAAFSEAVGLPFAEVEAAVRGHATTAVAKALAGRDAYLEARRAVDAGPADAAIAAADAYLAAHPSAPFAPRARYDRALALFRAGRSADALAAFDRVLAEPLAELYVDDVLEHRVRIAAARGDAAALEAAARAFVRDCSWVSKARIAAVRKLWTQGKDAAAPPPPPDADPPGDDDD